MAMVGEYQPREKTKCKVCTRTFIPYIASAKFCGEKCFKINHYLNLARLAMESKDDKLYGLPDIIIICPECGTSCNKYKTAQKYCSLKCLSAATRRHISDWHRNKRKMSGRK